MIRFEQAIASSREGWSLHAVTMQIGSGVKRSAAAHPCITVPMNRTRALYGQAVPHIRVGVLDASKDDERPEKSWTARNPQ